MKNFVLSIVLLSTFYFLSSVPAASAAVACQPIYGGGQTCVQSGNVVIDKKVQNPVNTVFVDNLTPNDPKYVPGQTVTFTITVSNTGGAMLPKVKVQDVFPVYVREYAGPGSISGNTLSFDVLNLNPGEARTFTVSAKVIGADQLPNKTVICEINNNVNDPLQNRAIAIVDGQTEDNAKFCIQKEAVGGPVTTTKGGLKILPAPQVTTTPSTGPEALALFALLPSGIAGLFLRRKAVLR